MELPQKSFQQEWCIVGVHRHFLRYLQAGLNDSDLQKTYAALREIPGENTISHPHPDNVSEKYLPFGGGIIWMYQRDGNHWGILSLSWTDKYADTNHPLDGLSRKTVQ